MDNIIFLFDFDSIKSFGRFNFYKGYNNSHLCIKNKFQGNKSDILLMVRKAMGHTYCEHARTDDLADSQV